MIMKEIICHTIFILKRKHLNVLVSIQERKIEEVGLGIDLPDCMMAIGRSVLSFFATTPLHGLRVIKIASMTCNRCMRNSNAFEALPK